MKWRIWRFFTVAVFAFGLSMSTAQAQNEGLDPFVEQLIEVTSNYLTSANAFHVKAEVTYEEVLNSGKKQQLSRLVEVMVRRPNRISCQ